MTAHGMSNLPSAMRKEEILKIKEQIRREKKGMRSYNKRRKEHEGYIKDPTTKNKNYWKENTRQDYEYHAKKWKKDIRGFRKEIAKKRTNVRRLKKKLEN